MSIPKSPPALRSRKIIPETALKLIWNEDNERTSTATSTNRKIVKKETNDNSRGKESALEVPKWTVVENHDAESIYKLPTKFIEYEGEHNIVEYEADEADEEFINKHANFRAMQNPEDFLEIAFDYFEKESFVSKEYASFLPVITEGPNCCVCKRLVLSEDGTPLDVMECQGCHIYSHARCQGIKDARKWHCRRCASEKNKERNYKDKCLKKARDLRCAICQEPGGSMRKSHDWVHNCCSDWLDSSLDTHDAFTSEPQKHVCCFCNEPSYLIKCAYSGCKRRYHGSCGEQNELFFEIVDGKHVSYCQPHSVRKYQLYLETLLPHGLAVVEIGSFLNQLTRIALERLVGISLSAATFNLIFEYWKQKRLKSDYGRKPLIGRLVVEKEILQSLNVKREEVKLSEARLRWEEVKEKLIPKKTTTKPKKVKSEKPKVIKTPKMSPPRKEKHSDSMDVISEESSETWRSEDKENQFDSHLGNERTKLANLQKRPSATRVMNDTTKKRKLNTRSTSNNTNKNNRNADDDSDSNSIDISEDCDEGSKPFIHEHDAESTDALLSIDRKQIVEEVERKSRPPTRASPQTLSSGIPTFYGSGDNRIAWTPNVDHGGKVLFGARYPTKLNHLTSKLPVHLQNSALGVPEYPQSLKWRQRKAIDLDWN